MNGNTNTNTNDLLLAAITGYEAQIRQMSERVAALKARVAESRVIVPSLTAIQRKVMRKHHVSAAGRKRIADAQRKRWRAQKKSKAVAKPAKKVGRKTGRKAAK